MYRRYTIRVKDLDQGIIVEQYYIQTIRKVYGRIQHIVNFHCMTHFEVEIGFTPDELSPL